MKNVNKLICVLLMIISVITYQFWYSLKEEYGIKVFYIGVALIFQGFTFVIWNESKSKAFRYFMEFFTLLCFNNLIDEAFFNPTKFEINEVIIALILLTRFILILWKLAKNNLRSLVQK